MNDDKSRNFEKLLNKTKKLVLEELAAIGNPTRLSGVEFEAIVAEKMVLAAEGTEFEGQIVPTGAQSFPDILTADAEFGVEVKVTASDKWVSTGNSILETTRKPAKKVYMFFGKLGGTPDIRYRPYEEVLPEIVATHSPRYLIDMNLGEGASIFDKMGLDYDRFRSGNPIASAQAHYKRQLKEGEQLWWISGDDDSSDASTSLVIKQYREFEPEAKRKFIARVMILFPEVFSTGSLSYRKAAAFLLAEYGAVHSSVRDEFTAGGTFGFSLGNNELKLPHIYGELYDNAKLIKRLLASSDELVEKYWGFIPAENMREQMWIERSKKLAAGLPDKDVFEQIYRRGLETAD